ncbi:MULTISPECIES: O-antigen polysaccharide polymerase Wzy [Myroides]|uniref:O-antigen polysaccharide polymerase Wzy n=1 Tax=Myroides odoratus TaxID=256 RepID=A0A9Q7E9K8_MYROD|nr:O-antigen polysaccharide polymerase Wzy [Myroides odoratus]EHQ43993.1 hypothetical protein Myrod_3177 [Myroides odoratus DSM 2801]EKB05110.1 hypothetical protein HMPREF9716_02917 [Myroides odoratus CIP 103059]QQU01292.1 O-antigen polysaccharide polymerase Wzy [Myroides odoratus]WQD56449.1 O-antigen polysaccharide polymerase Wzy [Myroides odoratus]STZ31271.1 Uncharacterised protein [Myroides odoratus]
MLVELFFIFAGIILYFLAPDTYSFFFVTVLFVLYLVYFYYGLRKYTVGRNYISFLLFFGISFFLVNFFYPVLIYPVNKDYFLVFERFTFNENVISKSTALAFLAFTFFMLGNKKALIRNRRKVNSSAYDLNLGIVNAICPILFLLSIASFLGLFFLAFDKILTRSTDAFFNIEPFFLVFVQCCMNILIIVSFVCKKRWFWFIIPLLYVLLFLYVGDRGPAIQTVLVFLFSYNYFRKIITLKQTSILFIGGLCLLTVVSSIRGRDGAKDISAVSFDSYYDLVMDLVVNNRNLYAGYEYVDKFGINYGKSSVVFIFAPIPLLPSYITKEVFDVKPNDISTASILTKDANAGWGLGTNLISDLYMQFHTLGVCVFMYLLGYVVKFYELKVKSNFTSLIVYFTISSFSIYMARSSLFDSFRFVIWSLLIFYFVYYFIKPKKSIVREYK